MSELSVFVERRTKFEYIDDEQPLNPRIPVVLFWDSDDPFAVEVCFQHCGQVWMLSREMLADGMNRRCVGLGDVSILPDLLDPEYVELILSSPTGRAGLRIARRTLREFLTKTWDAVPAGSESTEGITSG